uniref:Ocellatin-1 n=1 Tax=Leptodactylus ocellatus TaxID=928525 RepID=OCE1_LEPOE|nr:RecName: Full=Ocellatin-1 [Leptodactylus bolivianus]
GVVDILKGAGKDLLAHLVGKISEKV